MHGRQLHLTPAAPRPPPPTANKQTLPQNFHRFSGANTLAALVSGASARAAEDAAPEELKDAALAVLRRIHPGVEVPQPVAYTVSQWASGARGAAGGRRGLHGAAQAGCGASFASHWRVVPSRPGMRGAGRTPPAPQAALPTTRLPATSLLMWHLAARPC